MLQEIEALLDLGRHILAKGFGRGVSEYKEIATALGEEGGLKEELYEICTMQLDDVRTLAAALKRWLNNHPERVDPSL